MEEAPKYSLLQIYNPVQMGCLELSADMRGTCGKTYCRVCPLANTCMSFKSILNGKSKSGLKKKVGAVTTIGFSQTKLKLIKGVISPDFNFGNAKVSHDSRWGGIPLREKAKPSLCINTSTMVFLRWKGQVLVI